MSPAKVYDRAYFDRFYRGARFERVDSGAGLHRMVSAVVAVTELVLERPIGSVLDVGCGEARWQPVLHEIRPHASYLGIDSSVYAVERFGEARNIRGGRFEELELHVFERPFDLVVCADVLHYLTRREIERGLPTLAELVGGVAYLDVFTRQDDPEGDLDGYKRRSAATYRRLFRGVGLHPIGLHCYVPERRCGDLSALALPVG